MDGALGPAARLYDDYDGLLAPGESLKTAPGYQGFTADEVMPQLDEFIRGK